MSIDNNNTVFDSSGSTDGKSPKVFGLPRPYTGLYSSSSYMANRPSYMRNREPGQYTLSSSSSESAKKSSTSSLGRLPGVSGILSTPPNHDQPPRYSFKKICQ